MLFLLFASSLSRKLIVNSSNYREVSRASKSVPVLILFFSPLCGHCTRMHPAWLEFMDRYEHDEDILIAEVDCYNQRKVANLLASVDGYPTIMSVENGVFKEIRVTRTAAAFAEKAEELKVIFGRSSCKIVNTDNKIVYPAFVLRTVGNTTSACDTISQVSGAASWDKKDFYVMQAEIGAESDFAFYTSANMSTQCMDNSTDAMVKFVRDRAVKNLGDWELKDVLSNSRNIVFILYENGVSLISVKAVLNQNSDRFLFGKIDIKEFNRRIRNMENISNIDLPALLFYEKEKDAFRLVPGLSNDSKFKKAITDARNGVIDDKIIVNLDFFNVAENSNSKYRLLFGISICLITILLMGISIFGFLEDIESLDKIE